MKTIIHPMTRREFTFPSEDAYEEAKQWVAGASKHEVQELYFSHKDKPVPALWSDPECTVLAEDWELIAMSLYAWRKAKDAQE